ncbi:hypothetical protein EJ06DRAFT_530636 [Trichodelitschia bisporula]|uniref:Transcription factor Rba50 n=1 Tax=Trichodelitschia bisporula TaxID=703511 RepID=A0A6G1HVT3_9PEZI|nr:hypothetical protein EJ06DRAFT_530636 [Trichodelitschia bisporula]
MATLRGQRFEIDLSDDEHPATSKIPQIPGFIADIQERDPTNAAIPPSAPSLKNQTTGFPAHKKRTGASKFKQARQAPGASSEASTSEPDSVPDNLKAFEEVERQRINEENTQRLASMSDADIEQQRQELFGNLSPALIEKLLKRSTIDDSEMDTRKHLAPTPPALKKGVKPSPPMVPERRVSFAVPEDEMEELQRRPTAERHSISDTVLSSEQLFKSVDYNEPPKLQPASPRSHPNLKRKVSFAVPEPENGELERTTSESHSLQRTPSSEGSVSSAHSFASTPVEGLPSEGSIHFPKPLAAPELDPNSPSFLEDLHQKYFPDLVHDPSKLEWMSVPDPKENAAYDPTETSIEPTAIRFSFKGEIIPPSKSFSLPTDLGLHHHGDAPSAAGYTIPELAWLARSSFPAQRCIAIQTLGRILYRLGIGEFGDENELDVGGTVGGRAMLAKGLWGAIEEGRVIDTITEESKKERGHQTSIVLAQEAVWNWRKGGGRQRKAV